MWERIGEALQQEFSDVPDAAQAIRIVLRLVVAAILGGAIGFERELHGKAAGVRTHMLVALGAALFILVPQQMRVDDQALSRVLQGLVAGIGFLGAGAILKGESEEEVHGLTTAAGLWLTAAIGVTVGLGRELTAVLSTVLAILILAALPQIDWLMGRKQKPKNGGGDGPVQV